MKKKKIEKPIFTVSAYTPYHPGTHPVPAKTRTVGWFRTEKTAIKAAMECADSISEHGYYRYAVVEMVVSGFSVARPVQWLALMYDYKRESFYAMKIKTPEFAHNIWGFSID